MIYISKNSWLYICGIATIIAVVLLYFGWFKLEDPQDKGNKTAEKIKTEITDKDIDEANKDNKNDQDKKEINK